MLSLQLIIEFFNLNGGKVSQGQLELSVNDDVVDSIGLARHEGYVIDYSEDLNDYFKVHFPGSEVAGRTIDFDLNIVDLPSEPNKYSIGASFYARYWDRNPPNVLSDNIALTVDRSPSLQEANAVGDVQAITLSLANTAGYGHGMSVVQLAVPSCMTIDFNQLEILVENLTINAFELATNNEWLYLYFTYLGVDEVKDVSLTFVRQFEGVCKEQKTLAYLYYDEESRVLI